MVEDIRNYTLKELEEKFKSLGLPSYRARQVYGWLYKKGVEDFSLMVNVPQDVKERLEEVFKIEKLGLEEIETSRDLTQKFLFRLKDDALIEGVSIPFKSRVTVCLSAQVGCKFSCAFCASGLLGFKRDLSTSEIVSEFITIRKNVSSPITNVVFMGIGEPLDNYDNVMRAIRIMNSELGIRLGARKMTISTAGFAPGIERLSKEGLQVELSVSLHAATDEKRSEILPINRRFPLKALFEAIRKYYDATKRKVTFEYVLLGGYNTGVEDAQSLIKLMRGLNAKVNIIPYNPVISRVGFQAPSKLEVLFFKSYLAKNGIEATVRMPRGADIAAACGQLKYKMLKARKYDGS
ncbi:MAG: 23S rRNA (adenine(2503)-C(2))-methyltransferase RlmN [Candidatus Omnitrophota bacterium]